MEMINSVGRRKTSVARVYAKPGNGEILINKKGLDQYFGVGTLQKIVKQPLEVIENASNFDYKINVKGGGVKGQAEAIRLGISRALVKADEENKPALRKEGFLTRDSRMVERKKPGKKKARKSFQWTKR